MSRESAPRSSTKLAVGSTWASSTPNCSTMICLTFCSTDMHPPEFLPTNSLILPSEDRMLQLLCGCVFLGAWATHLHVGSVLRETNKFSWVSFAHAGENPLSRPLFRRCG